MLLCRPHYEVYEALQLSGGEYGVLHMEKDLFVPGNILVTTDHRILTIHINSGQVELVAGNQASGYKEGARANALFNAASGFVQTNSTTVIVVDENNNCLRIVNRLFDQTAQYAGQCGQSGRADGKFNTASFNRPFKIVQTSNRKLFVSDWNNQAIRKLDMETMAVSTVSLSQQPIGVTMSEDQSMLYFTYVYGLGRVHITSNEIEYLSANQTGFQDGYISVARFQRPEELIFITASTTLITDRQNHALRKYSTQSGNVTTEALCAKDTSNCNSTITFPRSLLWIPEQNLLLIGSGQYMNFINLTGITIRYFTNKC